MKKLIKIIFNILILIICVVVTLDFFGNNYLTKKIWYIKNSITNHHYLKIKKIVIYLPQDEWSLVRHNSLYMFGYAKLYRIPIVGIKVSNSFKNTKIFLINMHHQCIDFKKEQVDFITINNHSFVDFSCLNPKPNFIENQFRRLYSEEFNMQIDMMNYQPKYEKEYQIFLDSIKFKDNIK